MQERRISSALDRARAHKNGSVVEHELDMNRQTRRRGHFLGRISGLFRRLTPESGLLSPPMRSIARELEELFPSRDN